MFFFSFAICVWFLLLGDKLPGTPYRLAAAGSPYAPIAADAVSPFDAPSTTTVVAAVLPAAAAPVDPALGPNLVW